MSDSIRQVRIEKLRALRDAGHNPYPTKFDRTHTCLEASQLKEKTKKIKVAGRIMFERSFGQLAFMKLRDESGDFQIVLRIDTLGENNFKFWTKNLDMGDIIGATGDIIKTKTGEISLLASEIEILAKSLRPLPEKWHGIKDDDKRYRHRYLDFLLNEDSRRAVRIYSQIERTIREFFWSEDFTEFRVPVFENTATGAAAKPFSTHLDAYDIDIFLRICNGEIPQKKLMVGGFEKTFHMGPAFRNEGVDAGHNPEFNQCEAYWAYRNYEDMMKLLERLYTLIFEKTHGSKPFERDGVKLNFKGPYPRLTFAEALAGEGINLDKIPDEDSARQEAERRKIDVSKKIGYAEVVDELYKKTARPKIIQPTWLTDYPRELIPLAKRHPDNPSLIQSAQLVVQGSELIKLYSELTDPIEQAENFAEQTAVEERGAEEAFTGDDDFVEAMEYGMPPVTGMGIGIETTARIFAQVPDVREVILFPFMKPGKKGAGLKEK